MSVTLESLSKDLHRELAARPISECHDAVCALISDALRDDAFVARHLPDRKEGEHPREVLYEDPDLGFCICGHVYEGAANSTPHDHGSSWAIYGQAEGTTEMTDWTITHPGSGDTASKVVPERVYTLVRGDAHFYDVGAVHSPRRETTTRLIRVEGANLDHVQRSKIEAA